MPEFHLFAQDRVHHTWNKDAEAALRIAPGDTVYYETRDATDGQITPTSTTDDISDLDWDGFYPLAGPLHVQGAGAGDTLVVEILDVQHRGWGWTAILPEFGVLPEEFADPYLRIWEVPDGEFAYMDDVARVPIEPFAGTMGVASSEEGELAPMPPRHVGGNMDIRHLTAGTTLYLPVEVEGALFSIGDGHLAQGDGEVCVSAIEGPLGISCRFDVIKGQNILAPEFETSPGSLTPFGDEHGFFVTMGVAPDLLAATKDAVRHMVQRLHQLYGLSHQDAYILASVAADLKISEVVDPNWIVSLYMPKGCLLGRPDSRAKLSGRQ